MSVRSSSSIDFQSETIVAVAMSELNEGDVAALLAQLHVAVLMMIDQSLQVPKWARKHSDGYSKR